MTSSPQNLRAVGDRIESLLEELRATADPRSCELAEELLRLVTELYGGGLSRLVELAPERMDDFVADELVASLLLVHGLHPDSLATRVERALDSVRPFLGRHGGDVELLDIDESAGALHLRLLGSCDGCPSSSVTLQNAVEVAVVEAAPEIVIIDVEQPSANDDSVPIALGRKFVYESCPSELETVST
jgi:Fe-S cluster biogenesis protein NfuA